MSNHSPQFTRNTPTPQAKIKFGIVGCGRVAEQCQIPAALSAPSIELSALADSDPVRLDYVTRSFGLSCIATSSHTSLIGSVDAVLILLPNHLHCPIARDFINSGVHVLCEKPLAPTTQEARTMCALAEAKRVVLATGFVKRYEPNFELMKQLIGEEFLGQLHSFEFDYGTSGGWAPRSSYNLYRHEAGGGVLMVHGSHLIDRMISWFGYPANIKYWDDAHGGIEANCLGQFTFGSGLTGKITLSKTHNLPNRFCLYGEKGRLEIADAQHDTVTYFPAGKPNIRHEISMEPASPLLSDIDLFRSQLEDFARAIRSGTAPRVTGHDGLISTAVIEDCYRARQSLRSPGVTDSLKSLSSSCSSLRNNNGCADLRIGNGEAESDEHKMNELNSNSTANAQLAEYLHDGHQNSALSRNGASAERRVLVTGSTGFVGSRLCEVIHLSTNFALRPHVHSTGNSSYIARYPMDFFVGDLTDCSNVREAVEGCSYVVHLARGSKEVMIGGLENLLRAAVAARVRRFVHVSSVAVHGNNPPPEARYEIAPLSKTGNDYGDLKIEQERLVAHYGDKYGLPFVILRPPHVSGPNSHFINALIPRLRAGKLPLVDGGTNICNLVYIDNLIEAILLSLDNDNAVGETFFITDKEMVTWASCLSNYAALLNTEVPHAPAEDLETPSPPTLRESLARVSRVLLSSESRSAVMGIPGMGRLGKLLYRAYATLPEQRRNFIRSRLASPVIPRAAGPSPKKFDGTDYLIAPQLRTVVHSCEKAERLLGYTSPVSYREAMAITREWLEFAKMTPRSGSNICALTTHSYIG